MMVSFNAEVRTMREWRPRVEPEVMEHPVQEKSPFYIRSRFGNLSNSQTVLRLMSLEMGSKKEMDKVSSRKMRIYGKGHTILSENIEKEGDSRRLFRDWLYKEKCRQFFVMVRLEI